MARAKPAIEKVATAHAEKTSRTVETVTRKLVGTIGSRIDTMYALREQKRELEAKVKVVEDEYKVIETELLEALEREGTSNGKGKHASASVSVSVVGQITDVEAMNAYIKRSGNFQLYQQRLSTLAVRELLETKGAIPGVTPFNKVTLTLRTL